MSVLRSILYYILSAVTFVAGPLVWLVFRLIYGLKGQSVSKVTDPLLLASATSLAKKIRLRQVTAEEVMQAFIRRAREVNPIVNAIVAERYAEALEEAREVDRLLSGGSIPEELSERSKPFLGVPLTVKEAFALEGMPNCSGLVSRKGMKADSDCPAVHRLKESGMIPFACTNTSELCMWYESANNVYGRTKNAYDNTKIVGGSSGGEGCIISTGASLLGVGSDIGGSIRMPAFFNGVFGHRPSKNLVPNEGQHPPATGGQVELLATGPMCRYAEDLTPVLKIMAGPQAARLNLDTKVDMSTVKVYTMDSDGGSLFTGRVNPQLKEAQRKACDYLGSVGATTKPVKLGLMKYSLELWSAKMVSGQGTKFACFMAGGEHSGKKVNCFTEIFKWMLGRSDHTLPAIGLGVLETFTPDDDPNVPRLLTLLDGLHQQLTTLLADDGVLLYPSHPEPAPYHNHPLLTPFNFSYTGIFNALGFPVTQVPLGLSREGLPLGVQVVGAPDQDRLTLAVAAQLEKGFGGWVSPPGNQ
ncbi:fatty-acid amide hydrolase 2-A-like [Babylonia areolata]|uniref:fatty-acid amide hydrolase 2-A-like n=1 Tax=Babylonia areolata TaxID=304850 RepID=UPI003FD53DB6